MAAADGQVLYPLRYSPSCTAVVTIRNTGAKQIEFSASAHSMDGGVMAFTTAVPMRLQGGVELTLRLRAEGEAGTAWAMVREAMGSGGLPALAASGWTECAEGNELASVKASTVFPTENPWVELASDGESREAKEVWVVNASAEAARARVCFSSGVYTERTDGGGRAELVCGETREVFLGPFSARTVPVSRATSTGASKDGSARFRLTSEGERLGILPAPASETVVRKFAAESRIRFGEPVPEKTRP